MPREIPFPRPGVSPTSRSCGVVHGSSASMAVRPSPIQPHDAPALPPLPRPHQQWHQTTLGSIGDGRDGEGQGQGAAQECKLSPIGACTEDAPSFSGSRDGCSGRLQDSYERNRRTSLYMKKGNDHAPRQELGEETLRAAIHLAGWQYDQTILRKLGARISQPPSLPQHRLTPVQEIRGFAASQDTRWPSRPSAPQTSSQRHVPASARLPLRMLPSPLVVRGRVPGTALIHLRPERETSGLPVFSPSLSEFRGNCNPDAILPSCTTDGSISPTLDNRLRTSVRSLYLGPGCASPVEDSQVQDAPPSHGPEVGRLTLRDVRTLPPQCERVGSKSRASSPLLETHERDRRPHRSGTTDTSEGVLIRDGASPDLNCRNQGTPHFYHGDSQREYQGYYNPAQPESPASSPESAASATTMCSMSTGQLSPSASILSTPTAWSPMAPCNSSMKIDTAKDSLGSPAEMPSHGREQDSPTAKINPPPSMAGCFVCKCCRNKPKMFFNRDDLQRHERLKKYGCQHCSSLFKNKNEVRRHHRSLHLRDHSWSCASLAGNYEVAFHRSRHRPNSADECGYCGKEFPLPAQWERRIEHLTQGHKFGDCNQAKKFYRADHFRQHIRHSHRGLSGRWSYYLEKACMREEITTQPTDQQGAGIIDGISASSAQTSE